MIRSGYGRTVVVGDLDSVAAKDLERIRFSKNGKDGFPEQWLQTLISRHPNILPIDWIEPALRPAISVCIELPVQSGYVDNLFVTPAGGLIVGETKLFRNHEARRTVIGQILDYAKDMSQWTYEELDAAVRKAKLPDGSNGHPTTSLYEMVTSEAGDDKLDEASFIDAVSRNLRRGRFLLLIIGDGIRESTAHIADFLQQHAGMHFTLALIELAVFKMPDSGYLIQPRVLTQTENVERAIVRIEDGQVQVQPVSNGPSVQIALPRKSSITSEEFFEKIGASMPDAVQPLQELLPRLEAEGIHGEFGTASLMLRAYVSSSAPWNLATIDTSGRIYTEALNNKAEPLGCLDLARTYQSTLAELIPDAYVKERPDGRPQYVAKANRAIALTDILPHADGWIEAIRQFTKAVSDNLGD